MDKVPANRVPVIVVETYHNISKQIYNYRRFLSAMESSSNLIKKKKKMGQKRAFLEKGGGEGTEPPEEETTMKPQG